MTIENGPEESQPVEVPDESSQGQQPQDTSVEEESGNPAWQEFLDVLPTQLHSQVTPILEKWDRGVQQKFESIRTDEVTPYKQYDKYLEAEVDPETIDYALNIMQSLNDDPRQMWEAIAEYYKFEPPQPQQQPVQNFEDMDDVPEAGNIPQAEVERMARLEQGVELMAKMLYEQQQEKEQQVYDVQIDQEITKLREKNGEFDEQYVLMYALQNDVDLETAVGAYQNFTNQVAQKVNAPSAPSVIGSGGGTVGVNQVDPTNLTDKQRRELAVQMLKAAAEQG